jgi:hypothetical protein
MHMDAIETARTAIYLNAKLAGFPVDKFWGDGTRFRDSATRKVIAEDPASWLATLTQCKGFKTRMRFRKGEDRFPLHARTSHWVLKVVGPHAEQALRPSYEAPVQAGSDRRLWLVTYNPEHKGNDIPVGRRDLAQLAADLRTVLKQLIALTGSRVAPWQPTFIDLLTKFDADDGARMTPAVPTEVLGELPARIVGVACAANLFRGMGNWADNIYDADIQPRVEELTAALFNALADGLQRAVDSTLPPR